MHPPRPRPRRAPALTAAAVLAATALAGCGIADPLNDPAREDRPGGASRHEMAVPAPAGRAPRVVDPAPSAVAAIERFGRLYINWDHRTLADVQRRLTAISVGEASAMQARAAAHTPADYELRAGEIRNRGHIAAIAPARPAHPGRYVVVTREQTTGGEAYAGLEPAYHVTLATAQRVAGGWAVSEWRPQL